MSPSPLQKKVNRVILGSLKQIYFETKVYTSQTWLWAFNYILIIPFWVCIPILNVIYITEDWNITKLFDIETPDFCCSFKKILITFHPWGQRGCFWSLTAGNGYTAIFELMMTPSCHPPNVYGLSVADLYTLLRTWNLLSSRWWLTFQNSKMLLFYTLLWSDTISHVAVTVCHLFPERLKSHPLGG